MTTGKKEVRLKMTTVTIAFFSIIACMCGGGDEELVTAGQRTFHQYNLIDEAQQVDFSVETTKGTTVTKRMVGFGQHTATVALDSDTVGQTASRAMLAGTTQVVSLLNFRAGLRNYVFHFGTNVSPKALNIAVVPNERPMLHVVHSDWSLGPLDVYVTAPGASIAAVAPDATNLTYGNQATSESWIHTGANFQVRVTAAGTKNVLGDFGNFNNAQAYYKFFFAIAHQGNASTARPFGEVVR